MEQEVKQVPYGVADFARVMNQNLYYVDKTMYLPLLEKQPSNLFFIRPRRFGKSIFLSMLYSYYDCKQKEKFQSLFGDLWIGSHPTPLQGNYQVIFLDFSQITGKIDVLEERFNAYLCIKLDGFIRYYSEFYKEEEVSEILSKTEHADKLQLIFDASKVHNYPLYLIIDEYDNFTNVVLNEHGEGVYHAITHADGFYRDVFKKFKGNFERIFMMGVSPVTLDDVTSGYNIGWNISIKPEFNEMLGFSTQDVVDMFTYYKENGLLPADCNIDAIIEDMKPWYDNYCFAKQALENNNRMFNCDMVLYYLRNYMDYGHAPELELSHGYCDFFLLPDLTHYATQHSYILELKVLPKKEFDEEAKDGTHEDGTPMSKAEKQWEEAVEQINRYAVAPRVEALRQGTTLHKIIIQFKGWELARMEEI